MLWPTEQAIAEGLLILFQATSAPGKVAAAEAGGDPLEQYTTWHVGLQNRPSHILMPAGCLIINEGSL